MIRATIKRTILTLFVLPALLFSQGLNDFIRPFFGYYDSQSLTNAIGGATVACGHVIPGKTVNPANLGLHRFSLIQTSFLHGTFIGDNSDVSHTQFGGIYAIAPVRVYQGSLVFGFGIQKEVDFSDATDRTGYRYSEEGGIYATELGVSVEMVKNLFIGCEFQYLNGQDKASTTIPDSSLYLNSKYKGFNLTFGFIQRLTPLIQIGASVQLPTFIWVNDKLTIWQHNSAYNSSSETWNYLLTQPLAFHIGGAYLQKYVNVFYEFEWTDWRNLEFSSDEYYDSDIVWYNQVIQDTLKSTVTHHLGTAFHPPWLPIHFYAGYQYMPVQYSSVYTSNKRESYSLGLSYMLNQQFSFHGSFTKYFWKYYGDKESYRLFVFGVSLHY